MTEAIIIAAVFIVAGTVKGVLGLGLPTVALGLLAATAGLDTAMALMLAPSFVTNVWQACSGGNGRAVLKRIWPFLTLATVMVWPGVLLGAGWDASSLTAILGGVLAVYGAYGLARPAFLLAAGQDRWLGLLAGGVNGVLTGLTGSFVVPGVFYLQAVLRDRDQLVQAMGMLFTVSTVALALVLAGGGRLPADLSLASMAAVVPALVGMVLGRAMRTRLSEAVFRRVFFTALILLGGYLLLPHFFG